MEMSAYGVVLTMITAALVGGIIGGIIAMRQNWKKAQWEQSAKRQALLAQSWRDEMQRVKPNMLHLISGASFEKVPATWFGWNHSVSDVNKVMRAMNYSEIEAKRFLWKNRACNS